MYYVYMIRNSGDQLYIGITQDPERRLVHHNTKQGAEFTNRAPDYSVVFLEDHDTLAEARGREVQLKKWRREKKEMLIQRYQQGLATKQ